MDFSNLYITLHVSRIHHSDCPYKKRNSQKEFSMKNFYKLIGIIALAAVIFAGCASLFGGGGSARLPRDMIGKWYKTAEAAAVGDESQLNYEVFADGTITYYGGGAPVTAQITSYRRGEEIRSYTIDGVETNQSIFLFTSFRVNEAAGTRTPTLIVSDAPRGHSVFVNGTSFRASGAYTAPPARPTYDDPPASDAHLLIATWLKPGNPSVTIRFTADGRMIVNNTDSNEYRVSGNNIVIDNSTNNVLQYRIEGNELFISSNSIAWSVLLGGTYTRQ